MDPLTPSQKPARLDALDLLRGAIMIAMTLDHVRDFMSNRLHEDPTDLKTTSAAIFMTRWITHYCAPTFIFLAGAGAFLAGTRGKSKRELSWFLLTRGLWLAIFEVTIVRALWLFNYDFHVYGAGVFWAIGWSMVVLAGLIHLPTGAVAAFGLITIVSHNIFDGMTAGEVGLPAFLWMNLHSPNELPVFEGSAIKFGTAYCLIPWSGVMAAGYGFGSLFALDRAVRRKLFFALGAAAILGFVLLRYANVYGDARLWQKEDRPYFTLFSFINCTKYPPSLLYLLMTLGPAILAIAAFDRPLPAWSKPVVTIGRVPFFYYLLHLPLIHGTSVLIDFVRFGWSPQASAGPGDYSRAAPPAGYGIGLPAVYAVWVVVVLILYGPSKWFAGVKARNRSVWLSYV